MTGIGRSGEWARGEVARGESFYEDIKKNVKDLEETVDRGIAVDHEFVQILLDDIDALRSHPHYKEAGKIRELDALSQRVLKKAEPISTYEKQVEQAKAASVARAKYSASVHAQGPAAGPLAEPATLPVTDDLRAGIQKVGVNFMVRAIRPDGHCLFRSYATGLLASRYDQGELAGCLKACRDEGLISEEDLALLLDSLNRIKERPDQLEAIVSDSKISDGWVRALRSLVGQSLLRRLKTSKEEEIRALAFQMRSYIHELREVADDREVVKKYAEEISSMEQRRFGGEFELHLLDELLHTQSVELHVEHLSLVPDSTAALSENPRAIYLVQRGQDHIDAAFPKSP